MTGEPQPAALRELAVEAAGVGGRLCGSHFGAALRAESKSRAGDLVTAVDRAAEAAVRAALLGARPDDAILGEEQGLTPGRSGLVWVIDPLDGTTNYTRRIPFYATSVAVQRESDGQWLAGAVCAPSLSCTWSAASGLGATAEGEAGPRSLPLQIAPSSARLLGTGLSYDAGLRLQQIGRLGALMADYTDMRRIGAAALDLCLLAQGSFDAFIEDDLAVHDWAAGALIAEEAGAEVIRPTAAGGTVYARWR